MVDKINTRIVVIVTLALVIFASFSVVIMNYVYKTIHSDNIILTNNIFAGELSSAPDMEQRLSELFRQETVIEKIHITVYKSGGEVVGDNVFGDYVNADTVEQKNVYDALIGVFKPRLVHSDISNLDAVEYYGAFSYNGERFVLRTRMDVPTSIAFYVLLFPALLIVLIIVVMSLSRFKYTMNKNVIEPLSDLSNSIESMSRERYKLLNTHSNFNEVEAVMTRINNYNTKQLNSATLNLSNKKKINFVIKELSVGVVAFDSNGKILLCNNNALTIFGVTKNIIGKNVEAFFNDDLLYKKIKESIDSKINTAFSYMIDEKVFRVETIDLPLSERNYTRKDCLAVFTDITAESMLDSMRSEFFANASHELKTPITAVLGFSELLLIREDTEKIRPLIENIQRNSRKMYELIQDMMELSRLDANMTDENDSLIDVREAAEFACSTLTPLANQSNVKFRLRGQAFIHGKTKQIEQLLTNLISNAVKYNLPDGKVYIDVKTAGDNVSIAVRDSGKGIPPSDLPRVFERFFCVDKGRTRSSNSTGLGLAIVKQIVKRHNGRIVLESIYGKGTQFTVYLPIAQNTGAASVVEYKNDKFDIESEDVFGDDDQCKLRRIDDVVILRERIE